MEMSIRQRTGDPDEIRPDDGNIIVEISKGAGGKRWVEVPRASLAGKSHREVVQMALGGLGSDDPFVPDTQAILGDSSYSLERVDSGVQSRWLSREAPVDTESLEQERLRYALSHDHVGGLRC